MYYVESLIGGESIGTSKFETLEDAEIFTVMTVNSYKNSKHIKPEFWEILLRYDNEIVKRIKGTEQA